MSKFFNTKEQFLLILIASISVAIRLHVNFSTEYFPGNNGAYYLIMVRSLLEKGQLIRADFPLLFWLETAISFLIIKLGLANLSSAVDFTTRAFDSVVPVFSIVPAYLLTKRLLVNKDNFYAPILISSVSILYYSFITLVSDFQKNALGLLWLFWMIYFLLLVHEKPSFKNIFGLLVFLLLTGLTHYGCIAVAITIIMVDFLSRHFTGYSFKKFLKLTFFLIISIGVSVAVMYLINPWRVRTFIEIPFQIFKDPVFSRIINREPIITPFDVAGLLLTNILGVSALYFFVKRFKEINEKHRTYYLSMIILVLFLSSPFLAYEYAQRVYFISYMTAIPVVAFIYNIISNENGKKNILLIVSVTILCSVIDGLTKPTFSNMNKNLYSELNEIKTRIKINSTDVIIARHGMEFWSTWIIGADAFRQESTWPIYWKWYSKVYILNQKKSKSPFGPAGIFGKPFNEPQIPEKSVLVYCGEYFDLYQSPLPPENFENYNKPEF